MRQAYTGYQFIETGHSLGGLYAQLNAVDFPKNTESVCFDSPGIATLITVQQRSPLNATSFTAFVSAPNFINTSGKPLGALTRIYPKHISEGITPIPILSSLISITSDLIEGTHIILDIMQRDKDWFQKNQHSMANFLEKFAPDGVRHSLMRQVTSWPTTRSYLWYLMECFPNGLPSPMIATLVASQSNANRRIEGTFERMKDYSPGRFLAPSLKAFNENEVTTLATSLRGDFDNYYTDPLLKQLLVDAMQIQLKNARFNPPTIERVCGIISDMRERPRSLIAMGTSAVGNLFSGPWRKAKVPQGNP
ncbi:MAG: hypothetical protein K2Q14_00165 [Gammaproteobacteria bacterium]|nr:hypothetical protein [Gammaproteobacteria bacterium]